VQRRRARRIARVNVCGRIRFDPIRFAAPVGPAWPALRVSAHR
jgi:hypothetical protein